eukprot:gene11548-biopygen16875
MSGMGCKGRREFRKKPIATCSPNKMGTQPGREYAGSVRGACGEPKKIAISNKAKACGMRAGRVRGECGERGKRGERGRAGSGEVRGRAGSGEVSGTLARPPRQTRPGAVSESGVRSEAQNGPPWPREKRLRTRPGCVRNASVSSNSTVWDVFGTRPGLVRSRLS